MPLEEAGARQPEAGDCHTFVASLWPGNALQSRAGPGLAARLFWVLDVPQCPIKRRKPWRPGTAFLSVFTQQFSPRARLLSRTSPSTRGSILRSCCCCSAPVPAGAAGAVKPPPHGAATPPAHERPQGREGRAGERAGGSRVPGRGGLPWPRPGARPAAPPVAAVTAAPCAGPRELARRREHGAGSVPLGTGTAPPPLPW